MDSLCRWGAAGRGPHVWEGGVEAAGGFAPRRTSRTWGGSWLRDAPRLPGREGGEETDAADASGRQARNAFETAHTHRSVDEQLTERAEAFLAKRLADGQSFTAAELSEALAIPRFDERQAQLFLVALKGQGRARYDRAGWRAGPNAP